MNQRNTRRLDRCELPVIVVKPMPDLVEQLRRAMDDSGLTTYALAQQSGANITSLYLFRKGERDLTFAAACKVAQALGLTLVGADGKEIKAAARATRKRATPKKPQT